MIFHDFGKTSCFHAPFCVIFWQFRYFLEKNRYFHVHFCEMHSHIKLRTRIHRKKRGLRTLPTQNPRFLRLFQTATFQNPVFLQSFWLDLVSPRPAWIAAWAAFFLEMPAKNEVLETWARKNMQKRRGFAAGKHQNLVLYIFSCR